MEWSMAQKSQFGQQELFAMRFEMVNARRLQRRERSVARVPMELELRLVEKEAQKLWRVPMPSRPFNA